ncbi:MAG: ABC transporter ATP-binding protein [Bacilli bacterium]
MIKSFIKNVKIIRYVFRFCPMYVVISLLYIIANALSAILKIFLIKKVIDLVVNGQNFDLVLTELIIYMAFIFIASLVKVAYDSYYFNHYRTIYIGKMQNLMYSMTKTIDYEDFDNPEFYDKYSRALRDGSTRGIRVYEDLVRFASSMVNSIAIGSIILVSDPLLLVIILSSSLISIVGSNLINKKWYQLDKKTEKNRRMYRYVNRVFYQQKYAAEIKTTSMGDLLVQRYKDHAKIINHEYLTTQRKISLITLLNQFASIFIEQGGTYIYMTVKLFKNIVQLGDFTSILNAGLSLSGNFVEAINFLTRIKLNALYIDDFLWYMNYQPKLETKGKDSINELLAYITIQDLDFKYPNNEEKTLSDLNLKIKQGEKLAIVGLNGAGKTTLVKLLLKFYEYEHGKLLFNNQDYRDLSESDLRRQFSIVFQDFQIYAVTIGENILMRDLKTKDDEILIWEALDKVGLRGFVEKLPDGIHTLVTKEFDQNGVVFSGGDRQKLAIARVFASDASIYILDEPTSSLDPYSEKAINDLIITNASNKTIIIIAHRLSTVVDVDHIILLEHGTIIESGNHQQLIDLKNRYYQLFSTQASMYKKNNGEKEEVIEDILIEDTI